MENFIDDLDFLYEQSLGEELCDKDKQFIISKMESIAAWCDKWLTKAKKLTGEAVMRFSALKKSALATIADVTRGTDVLTHWCVQREALTNLLRCDKIFHRQIFTEDPA